MNRLFVVLVVAVLPASYASAWEFRTRFVERIGNQDIPITSNLFYLDSFSPHNIRLQCGVFDDAAGPAPAGGFVGWNVGSMQFSGPQNPDIVEFRRNPGRLAPFNFNPTPNANGNPPLPNGDPFFSLTDIDATLGLQSLLWVCDAEGNPAPPPAPVIRGRNTFVSIYAFSVQAHDFVFGSMRLSGNLIAANEWRGVGAPTPPDCSDPDNPIPGSVNYAPFVAAPQGFESTLFFTVPGAATGWVMVLGGIAGVRRRRIAR